MRISPDLATYKGGTGAIVSCTNNPIALAMLSSQSLAFSQSAEVNAQTIGTSVSPSGRGGRA